MIAQEARLELDSFAVFARRTRRHLVQLHHSNSSQLMFASTCSMTG